MKIVFLAQSVRELEDGFVFYNDQLQGLGNQFYTEVFDSIDIIKKYPAIWDKVGQNTRKCILKRFPYLILYICEKDKIIVTAIAHQHRKPSR
jgi:hypothetical protein